MIYLPLVICAFLEGFGKSLQDSMIVGHWWSTIFSKYPQNSFFGNDGSRKYKNGDSKQGEKFFLSTSLFVFVTDCFHASGTLMIFSQIISLYFALSLPFDMNQIWYIVIGYWLLRTSTFHIFYTYIFLKNANNN